MAEHDANRSSALTPDMLALINSQTQVAVQEAMKGALAMLAPMVAAIKDSALTPEKMAELKRPYVDPNVAARELRETQNSKEQEAELQKQIAWRKAHCPHKDKNGNDSICPVHNQLDHQPRGICMLCHDWIHPREWVIDAPDPNTGKTKSHIREAHKDYARVLQIVSMA
jgi:hypothetical protein